MAASIKAPKHKRPTLRRRRKTARSARREKPNDLAERKKIEETLDMDAFLKFHEKNKASTKYWETEE
jgi:hypothetical protein